MDSTRGFVKYALLLVAALVAGPAQAEPPTDASISALMQAMDAPKMLDAAMGQVDQAMQTGAQQMLKGKQLTPEAQKALDTMRAKTVALFRDEMSWDKMAPTFTEVYKKSFSQSEVDGMIAFYRSEAGRAVVTKMPMVMQNTMLLMQKKMETMGPKLQQIQQEMVDEIKAASCKQKARCT